MGERLTATSNPAIGVLNLVDISPRHQGDYQCRATYLGIGTIVSQPSSLRVLGFLESLNNMDITKGTYHLSIFHEFIELRKRFNHVNLRFDRCQLSSHSTTGSKANLHCEPTMGEVSWTFNDSPLSVSSTSLVINSAGEEDEGTYKCQVSFQGETISSSATVTVSG